MTNKILEQLSEHIDQAVYSGTELFSNKADIIEMIQCFDRWKEELNFQLKEFKAEVKNETKPTIDKSSEIVEKKFVVEMFTDGSSLGNPGKGGWGTIIRFGEKEIELSGGEHDTTNNRMELLGVIKGLEKLVKPCHIKLCSDSKYVLQGIDEWLPNWIKNNWRGSNKQPVKNDDLWKRFIEVSKIHTIEVEWVKGHNNHPENERCDILARTAAENV